MVNIFSSSNDITNDLYPPLQVLSIVWVLEETVGVALSIDPEFTIGACLIYRQQALCLIEISVMLRVYDTMLNINNPRFGEKPGKHFCKLTRLCYDNIRRKLFGKE